MHTDVNIYADLRHRERQRHEHVEQGRHLRALSETEGPARETLRGRWAATSGLLSMRWNLTSHLRRKSESSVAGAA